MVKIIGSRLKEVRVRKGMSAQQVSFGTGISVQMIYSIENAKYNSVSVLFVIKLGKFYGLSFDELFTEV